MLPSRIKKNEMSRNPAKAGNRSSKVCKADIGVTTDQFVIPARMDPESHLFRDIYIILESGMDPQELIDRLGRIIVVIVGNLEEKKKLKWEKDRRRELYLPDFSFSDREE